MARYSIDLLVDAEHQWEARDLANAVQAAIRNAQKAGRYAGVTVISGPSVGVMQTVTLTQFGSVLMPDADGIIRFPVAGTCGVTS